MPDVAIENTTTQSVPKDYVLPGTQELQVKAVRAVIDGTGAASAYFPALQLIAPDGTVMFTGIATSSVAAGASVNASWFPFRPCPPAANWPNNNQTNTALAFGPWAFWKLNEANGVSPDLDSSGHGRTITTRVADVLGGRSGIVPTTSDTSSFVIWNAATNLTPWVSVATQTWTPSVGSWEYWINTPGHGANELNLGCHGTLSSAASRVFRHFLNATGQPVLEFQDTGGTLHTLTTAVGLFDNSTHQLVYVLDNTNLTVYVDGAQAGQQAQGATMKNPFTATLTLGMSLGGAGSRYYTGFIEHVGWYDQVLSAANVLSLYQAGTVLP